MDWNFFEYKDKNRKIQKFAQKIAWNFRNKHTITAKIYTKILPIKMR